MNSWKEKATEKLCRLFSDSPASLSPHSSHHPLARPYPEGGKSLSSIFNFILPSTSLSRSKSKNDSDDIKPIQSPPVEWKSRSGLWQGLPLDSYEECNHSHEDKAFPNSDSKEQERGSERRNGLGNGDPITDSIPIRSGLFDNADNHQNVKSMSYLTEESSFISCDLYEFLLSCLPIIVKGCQWVLLYSTVKHGISLRTLVRRSADLPGPCLLIAGDKQGAVFGGLLECPLQPTPKRKYQGTNKTFVFTTRYGDPRLFTPTSANRYYYMCLNDLLALGGGENMALCLDGDLLTGTSGPCETFGNSCLAHNQEFELKNVELWGFAHSSRYLS